SPRGISGMTDRVRKAMVGFPRFEPGHVWLAGGGAGAPGLLTLHALAGLAEADVVVHDALVDDRVLSLANPGATLEFAGKRGGRPSPSQANITDRLIALPGVTSGLAALTVASIPATLRGVN